jgi:hypothetical protein
MQMKFVRALSVSAMAVMGVFVIAASEAHASEPVYFGSTTNEYPETIHTTVSKMTVLEYGNDTVSCGKVEFTNELSAISTTLKLSPSYSECKADLDGTEASATVNPGTCGFDLSGGKEGKESEGEIAEITTEEAIVPSGCGPIKIEVSSAKCKFEIPSQSGGVDSVITPNSETGINITSEMSEPTVTQSGCTKCNEVVAAHGIVVWIIVEGILKRYLEFVDLHFNWVYNGNIVTGLKFAENQEVTVEKHNGERWPLYLASGAKEGNTNWVFNSIAGEPGKECLGIFLLPGRGCKLKIKSPKEKPAKANIKTYGVIYKRGMLELEVNRAEEP